MIQHHLLIRSTSDHHSGEILSTTARNVWNASTSITLSIWSVSFYDIDLSRISSSSKLSLVPYASPFWRIKARSWGMNLLELRSTGIGISSMAKLLFSQHSFIAMYHAANKSIIQYESIINNLVSRTKDICLLTLNNLFEQYHHSRRPLFPQKYNSTCYLYLS